MICTSCSTTYSPSPEELGQVETLEGLCDRCGTEPRLKRFAISFIEGAIAGVVAIEFLLLLALLDGWRGALIPPIVVAIVCIAVYFFANRTEPVRYRTKKERKQQTKGQRLAGWLIGAALGFSTLIGFVVT